MAASSQSLKAMARRLGRLARFAKPARRAPRGALRRFGRARSGATAVEFALVAAPFFALMFATLEGAILFYAGQTLETAVADSSRLILTGQAQKGGFDAAAFKQALCTRIYGLFDCKNGIYVDVRTANNFGAANTAKPIDASGNFVNNFTYDPGKAGDIVVVRVMYQWPVYVSLLGLNLSNMQGGKHLLMATAAFRNEPF